MAFARNLAGPDYAPVAAPQGERLRLSDLLAQPSWSWFDVLHLHSVELTSLVELRAVMRRARAEAKRAVVTAHDLVPGIEQDEVAYREKLACAIET